MPKGTKILMVDDDKMLIDMYKERLELAGYQVEISRDGEEGLAKVHQVKPDIVLLDIMMPKVNGYETLASIKSDPATKDIPVIILSALMRDVNKSKAVEAGADDYIIKSEAMPVDVIKKVEAVLKKYNKSVPVSSAPQAKTEDMPASKEPTITQAAEEAQKPENSPVIEIRESTKTPPAPTSPNPTSPPPPGNPPKAVPQEVSVPPLNPQITPNATAQSKQPSPAIIFLLILIVILILASDAFFYIRYLNP